MRINLVKIANIAGKKIMEIYEKKDFQIRIKKDKSPLTLADTLSNKIIVENLKKLSDLPILSEEICIPYIKRKDWKKYWLVDPLDGTKDFIAKNDEFTLNIALIFRNKPVLGVIHCPALKLTYYSELNKGSFKNDIKIFNTSKRTNLIGCDSRFHSTQETKGFFKKNNIKIIKQYGSALKFGKLAEGKIDVYPRLNGTKEWDTAAGQIILNEAGCKIIDLVTKKEFVYNKEKILNNFFIASRNDLNFI